MEEKMRYNLVMYTADKGESQTPALNVIMFGELLTTVEIISNLLWTFTFDGEVWIFVKSTPFPDFTSAVLVAAELVLKVVNMHVGFGLVEMELY